MGEAQAEASLSTWFRDPRTPARRLRASWHPDAGVVVLSLWAGEVCAATFRLPIEDVPGFMHLLVDALADAPAPRPPAAAALHRGVWTRLRRVFRARSIAPVVPFHHPD